MKQGEYEVCGWLSATIKAEIGGEDTALAKKESARMVSSQTVTGMRKCDEDCRLPIHCAGLHHGRNRYHLEITHGSGYQ